MRYQVTHRTTYEYAAPVAVSHHVARLEPRASETQLCESFALRIHPKPTVRKARQDYFGNQLCVFGLQEIHERLELVASSHVTLRPSAQAAVDDSPPWREVTRLFRDPVSPGVVEPYQFVFDSAQVRASPALADYAAASFGEATRLLEGTRDLNRRIFTDFVYDPKATTVATPLEEVWANRRGVCQDFAHVAIASLRSLGLPARYVSGYLRTRQAPRKQLLTGADASHAWFSIFCPGKGWTDFDPTNNVRVTDEHITLAYGRDFDDVSPVTGILTGGGKHTVKVEVDVTEI